MTDQPSPYLQPAGGTPSTGGAPAPYPPHAAYGAPVPVGVDGPWGPLADWGSRVGALLIDVLVNLVGVVPYILGIVLVVAGADDGYEPTATGFQPRTVDKGMVVSGIVLVVVGFLTVLGLTIWNRFVRQGRTGQSIGKKVLGLKLVDERTGAPIGAGMAFVRELCHNLDGMVYIGYLWPLWDTKRQTFADKIVGTVVVRVPKD